MTAEEFIVGAFKLLLAVLAKATYFGGAVADSGMENHHHHHAMLESAQGPLMLAGFVAILSFSFFSSLHCAAMCAPLVCAGLTREAKPTHRDMLIYNLTRGFGYVSAGALLGSVSEKFREIFPGAGMFLSFTLGGLIILSALGLHTTRFAFLRRVQSPARWIAAMILHIRQRSPAAIAPVLGLVTTILPCMTLTPALMSAAAAPTPMAGALQMGAFYLGTLPVMFIAPFIPGTLARSIPPRRLRWITLTFLVFVGFLTILRNFHGLLMMGN